MSLRSPRNWTVQARCVHVAVSALSSPAAVRKRITGLPEKGTIRPELGRMSDALTSSSISESEGSEETGGTT